MSELRKMLPTNPRPETVDVTQGNAIFLRELNSSLWTQSGISNLFDCCGGNLRSLTAFASRLIWSIAGYYESHFYSMIVIFFWRGPFQVEPMIMRFDCINVVYLMSRRWLGTMERYANQLMNREAKRVAVDYQSSHMIPVAIKFEFQEDSGVNAKDSSEVRYSVSALIARDIFPNFDAILYFIHDKFLLNRNWLWLEPSGCLPHSFGSFSLSRGGEN